MRCEAPGEGNGRHIGVPTVDGLGPVGGDDHTEREWIELASVEPRVRAIVTLCEVLARERHDAAAGSA